MGSRSTGVTEYGQNPPVIGIIAIWGPISSPQLNSKASEFAVIMIKLKKAI
jgi:hypothetical protein